MPTKRETPVLFTGSITLDELRAGTNIAAKGISAKVLKEYLDEILDQGIIVSGGSIVDSDEDF